MRFVSSVGILKCLCDQKITDSYFSLDFKIMLIKQLVTQVLIFDLKKALVYFNWNFDLIKVRHN